MNGNIEQQLLGEYAGEGYSVQEDADHVLVIWFKGQMIAAFSQLGATPEAVRNICRRHKERLMEAKI